MIETSPNAMRDSGEAAATVQPGENPFSTRFVRPGALEFVLPPGMTIEPLVAKFFQHGRRAQIVGPHGSGKSTLLAAIVAALARHGLQFQPRVERIESHTLHDGCRRLNLAAHNLSPSVVVVIDGFEQLRWWSRCNVLRTTRRSGAGLIVTTHQPLALPTLWATQPTPELVELLVAALLKRVQDDSHDAVSAAEVRSVFHACGGNVREVFFRLYDLYESQLT